MRFSDIQVKIEDDVEETKPVVENTVPDKKETTEVDKATVVKEEVRKKNELISHRFLFGRKM